MKEVISWDKDGTFPPPLTGPEESPWPVRRVILSELVFDPNNATTFGRVEEAVKEALARWEPRIMVMEVNARADPQERNKLLIDIGYQIKASNDRRNLVYPFYLIPKEM